MGKIHKALEKSKKEQKQSRKNPFQSFKAQQKVRPRPTDGIGKKRSRLNIPEPADSNFGAIHTLLNDTAKTEPAQKDPKAFKETKKASEQKESTAREPKRDYRDDKDQARGFDSESSGKLKYEPPATRTREADTRQNDEVVEEPTIQETQSNIAQKIVSLRSNQQVEPEVQYISDDDYAKPPERSEAFYPQERTGATTRLHYSLVTLGKPKSFEAEQFKILRANLLFPKSGKPPKTILLTSAVPGEGKTFTAMNLAVSLAHNINSHVLLVDADIRKPEVHKRFGLGDNIYGLSDYLTRDMPIPSLLAKTPLSNLNILPGGQATINPSELISSDKMKRLLNELSTRYSDRFVIIDAPPPKLAAETYALARFVEHIIPVVRAGRSNRDLVDEMMSLLGRDKIQGVVLNCYDIRDTKRFGYHKYSEYYSK